MPSLLTIALGLLLGIGGIFRGIFELKEAVILGPPEFEHVNVTLADPAAVVQRFAGILKYRTVSDMQADNHVIDKDEFSGLLKYLEASFPVVWSKVSIEKVRTLPSQGFAASPLAILLKWGYTLPVRKWN
jgi:hypothetical protein